MRRIGIAVDCDTSAGLRRAQAQEQLAPFNQIRAAVVEVELAEYARRGIAIEPARRSRECNDAIVERVRDPDFGLRH